MTVQFSDTKIEGQGHSQGHNCFFFDWATRRFTPIYTKFDIALLHHPPQALSVFAWHM